MNNKLFLIDIDGWEIIKAIPITVKVNESDNVLMSDSLFNVYGEGIFIDDALEDYEKSLVEYYELLESHVTPHHPETLLTLNVLKQYLVRVGESNHDSNS